MWFSCSVLVSVLLVLVYGCMCILFRVGFRVVLWMVMIVFRFVLWLW